MLNPDVEVTEGSVGSLVAFMDRSPAVGLAGAKLVYPDGTLQMSCRTFYTLRTVLLRRTPLGKVFPNARVVREHLMAGLGPRLGAGGGLGARRLHDGPARGLREPGGYGRAVLPVPRGRRLVLQDEEARLEGLLRAVGGDAALPQA